MEQASLLPPDEPASVGTHEFALDYPESELVFGLVFAVGTDYRPVLDFLRDQIRLCGYTVTDHQISQWFPETCERLGIPFVNKDTHELIRINNNIEAGNQIRIATKRNDFFALLAAAKLSSLRPNDTNGDPVACIRTAHIVVSLKRPEEVESLRKIYGPGFFLIGIFSDEVERTEYLTERKGLASKEAAALVERDQKEKTVERGQRTRDTFQMADVFIGLKEKEYEHGLRRFLKLVFGDPFSTPTRDEHSMFLAYAASLRSGDLARQVGAALACSEGDIISLGCNDVPAPGGGLYSCDDGISDSRDYKQGRDQNDERKAEIIDDVIRTFRTNFLPNEDEQELLLKARPLLSRTLVSDVTEYGRALHAEMDALIAAGRNGVNFRSAVLYTTTFPCHTCTRHIIAAGIKRVVYIEPYPKSLAPTLHDDAIVLSSTTNDKDRRIPFQPFLGIGPRRFFDLFSLKLSSGYAVERKSGGKMVNWDYRSDAKPRVPMPPTSYLEREQIIQRTLNAIIEASKDQNNAPKETTTSQERQGVLDASGTDSPPSRKLAQVEDRRGGGVNFPTLGEKQPS